MIRIGVISAYSHDDWHACRIAEAAARAADVDILAPTDFAAEVDCNRARVTVRGRDAAEWDLFLTPRALGDEGDADVQLETLSGPRAIRRAPGQRRRRAPRRHR